MANISGNVCNTYIHIDLIVTETATSIADNTSTVSWKLVGYMGSGGTSSYWYGNSYHTINVKINGSTVYTRANTTQQLISIGTNHTQASPFTIASGTATVPHNNDGTKVCSASFSVAYRYSSSFSWSGAGNVTLTTIARASSPTLSKTSANFGDSITVTTNRASTSFTHKLYYIIANSGEQLIAENVGDSYTWTIDNSLMDYIPYNESEEVRIKVYTYSGGSLVGSDYTSFIGNVPSNIVPSITAINCIEAYGEQYVTTYGAYIQGISTLCLNKDGIVASGNYSIIEMYEVTFQGKTETYSGYESSYFEKYWQLPSAGNFDLTVKAIDGRGRTASKTITITVLAYTSPTISKFNAYRCNSAGTVDENGAYIKVELSAAITPLNNKNSKSFILKYKDTDDTDYTTYTTYNSGYTWTTNYVIPASTESAYTMGLDVQDAFNLAVWEIDVSTAYTLMDMNASGKGIAFGKVSEGNNFDVNMPTVFRQGVTTAQGADLDDLLAKVAELEGRITRLENKV